jgi:hypothetical protein
MGAYVTGMTRLRDAPVCDRCNRRLRSGNDRYQQGEWGRQFKLPIDMVFSPLAPHSKRGFPIVLFTALHRIAVLDPRCEWLFTKSANLVLW